MKGTLGKDVDDALDVCYNDKDSWKLGASRTYVNAVADILNHDDHKVRSQKIKFYSK